MIEHVKSFKTSDGTIHSSIAGAQAHELGTFLNGKIDITGQEPTMDIAKVLVEHKEKIVDLLTLSATSRPKARKANGATKKRSEKTNAGQAANPPVGAVGERQ